MSLAYLVDPGCRLEFAIIDGDHNHFTVYHELTLIERAAGAERRRGSCSSTTWRPCGRRDSYYDPSGLPPEAVHPHSFELA